MEVGCHIVKEQFNEVHCVFSGFGLGRGEGAEANKEGGVDYAAVVEEDADNLADEISSALVAGGVTLRGLTYCIVAL